VVAGRLILGASSILGGDRVAQRRILHREPARSAMVDRDA
jgi:hypothetical protein